MERYTLNIHIWSDFDDQKNFKFLTKLKTDVIGNFSALQNTVEVDVVVKFSALKETDDNKISYIKQKHPRL